MNVELADERVLILPDQFSLEQARDRAWTKRVEAFGTLARMSGLLNKPKDEEFDLVYTERRLQPFWRLVASATYAYERKRSYIVKVPAEVQSVAIAGETLATPKGDFVIGGLETCREEHRSETLFDGLTKAAAPDLAAYLKFQGALTDTDALAALTRDGVIVVPPEARASMLMRDVIAGMMTKIDADRVIEETVRLEIVDLYYRPIYAFRYRRQGKEAVVECDAVTGVAKPGGATFERYLGKVLDPAFLFDVTVETANIFLPGATLARVLVNKGLELRKH